MLLGNADEGTDSTHAVDATGGRARSGLPLLYQDYVAACTYEVRSWECLTASFLTPTVG